MAHDPFAFAELEGTGRLMGSVDDEPGITRVVPDSATYNAWMMKAEEIFTERNLMRNSAFKGAGWKGQLVEMRKKLDRLWAAWQMDRALTQKDIDEALDLINATVFFLICADENNPNGDWPWP